MKTKTKPADPRIVVKRMIEEGIQRLSEKTGLPVEYYSYNIDGSKIQEQLEKLENAHKSEKGYDIKKDKKFQKEFEEYIAQGGILNEKAKKASSLEDEAIEIKPQTFYEKLNRFIRGKKFKNVDSRVHKHASKLKGIASLVQSDPVYAKLSPDIAKSLKNVNQLNYASNLLKVAHAEGMIGKKEYLNLVDKLYTKAESAVKEVPMKIKDYIGKIAASIFALFGIFLIFTQAMSITGNTIGTTGDYSYGIFVAQGLLIVSILLFQLNKKKRFRKIKSNKI